MGKDCFWASAMGLAAEYAATVRRANGDWRPELAARTVAQPGRFRHQLIVGRQDVVDELDFDDGPQAVRAHADRSRHDATFGDRRIEATLGAVLLCKSLGRTKNPAEVPNVLSED